MALPVQEDDKYLIKLGENIKKLRISKGITQKELANRCDFEASNMRRIEAGNNNVTIKTLLKIAKAIGVDIRKLLEF